MAGGTFIRFTGVPEFQAALRAIELRVAAAGREATALGAHAIEARAKAKLTARGNSKGSPSPSPEGEAPATVTGTLKRSVRSTRPTVIGFGAYRAEVGPTVVYGRIQELGGDIYPVNAPHLRFQFNGGWVTTDHVHIPARPYLRPSLEEAGDELVAIYRAAWAGAIHV